MSEVFKEKILSKFQKLDEYLANLYQLKKEIKSEKEFLSDFHLYGLAERYLQLSCQVVLDVVDLIIISKGLQKPQDRQEAVSILFEHKDISEDMANKLQKISGFRNILVHEYGKIDKKEVYKVLKGEMGDLEKFKRAILKSIR